MKLKGILALVSALVLVGVAQPASAGVHLEPYIGYGMGSWEAGTSGEDYTGVVYGGRLGYTTLGLAGGLEYMSGSFKDKGTVPATITPGDIGVWVGYTFPILIRAYGTYFFSSKSNLKSDAPLDLDLEGTGMKLGVGFTFLPFLSLNIEYLTNEFDEVTVGLAKESPTSKTTLITVSIPLDI